MRATGRSLALLALACAPMACAVYQREPLKKRAPIADDSGNAGDMSSPDPIKEGETGGSPSVIAGGPNYGSGASGGGSSSTAGGDSEPAAGEAGESAMAGDGGGSLGGNNAGSHAGGKAGNGGNGGHAGVGGTGGNSGAATGGVSSAGTGGVGGAGASAGGASAGGSSGASGSHSGAGSGGQSSGPSCNDHPLTARATWLATASHDDAGKALAQSTLDGKTTRWTTGKAQSGDEWLQLDFGKTVTINHVNLQQGDDTNDYPRSYAVIVSDTAKDLGGTVLLSGMGKSGVSTAILLPALASGRYLLVKQLGSSLSWWSAEEVEISCAE